MLKNTTKSQIEFHLRNGVPVEKIAQMVKRTPEYVRTVRSKLKARTGKRSNVG